MFLHKVPCILVLVVTNYGISSVIPATALKKNNPSVQKRLLNKTSVNNIEWLCKTCNKRLNNNKVPPCAAINGMKFTSGRDEMSDLLKNCSSYQEHYLQVKNMIDEHMKLFAMCTDDLNEIQNQLNNMEDTDDNYDRIAPGTQSIKLQDEFEGTQDLRPDFNENYDLSGDLGIPSAASNTEQLILHEEQDDVYRGMVQKLNGEQKEFFYHVLHLFKASDDPFYCFLSGGASAGVGKSHLTKCLYQAALKYYNTRAGDDFHQVKILMLTPTGKAAYNIKGNTIHRALAVPASQSLKNYKHLDSSRLSTIRCELGALKLIFLDGISMVGSAMFNVQINNRLNDIKGSNKTLVVVIFCS